MAKFFKTEHITLAKQVLSMGQRCPGFMVRQGRAQVRWTGWLRPSALSGEYKVEIALRQGGFPKARVLEPALQSRPDGQRIPHVYPGKELCLHLPGEWQPRMFVSETTVPWTLLWLLFYEYWQATGEWHGEGEHPPSKSRPQGRQAA